MIEVVILDEDETEIASMYRNIIPRVGELIELDEDNAIKISTVIHPWNKVDLVFMYGKKLRRNQNES